MKKTILHIITDLGRGGAETMLVTVVKELHDYNNIIVTLFPKNQFEGEIRCDKYFCLDLKSFFQLPLAIPKLKKIIKENNVDIVHSHLFWPTILARLATPKTIPLATTIHAFIASSNEYQYRYIKFLDRITYRLRKNTIIAVAEGAKKEYFSFLGLTPYKAYTLYTFVDTKIFTIEKIPVADQDNSVFKLISVAALRKQKNLLYLLQAFKKLNNSLYQLDIYGEGPLEHELKSFITSNNLNVHLKGSVKNIQHIIPEYELFVMSSIYEGFSLSVLEGMAMKVPLLLSNIASFREQCENTAVYFDLNNPDDFIAKLNQLSHDKSKLRSMAEEAQKRVLSNFTLEQHMASLRKIYGEIANEK